MMKLEVHLQGVKRTVEIEPLGPGSFRAQIAGHANAAEAVEVGTDTYSILLSGRAFDVRVSPDAHGEDNLLVRFGGSEFRVQVRDPRSWRGSRHDVLEASGPQQVLAPMPGKVVRVLVAAGEEIEMGRGLVVVEAMKMQNEIRAPKSGRIERVLVTEGQAVRTQEALVIIA
jgi:biotin carboxyl carrier protein